jgi:GT2 family glycosyltransferase
VTIPDNPPVGIVITDFNGWAQTRLCLAALRKSRCRSFETIVVDHGTSRETGDGLARDFPEVTRIEGSPDLWWAGATNLGIRAALEGPARYVMLLNNDCYLHEDTLGILLEQAAREPEAVVAPVQEDFETGECLSIAPRSNLLLGFPTAPGGPKRVRPWMRARGLIPTRLIVGGRGVLIPRQVFSTVGLLDEDNLPHYGADHDFFLRCREKKVSLRVAVEARVSIDSTRTSLASRADRLDWSAFKGSLTHTRSHRNIRHTRALFRKHYPIKRLYMLGVWLYVGRYASVYAITRLRRMIAGRNTGRAL